MKAALEMMLILWGMAALGAVVSRRRIELWFAPAVLAAMGVLYAFALAGVPGWGYHAVRALGIAALVAAAVLLALGKEGRSMVFTPGCLAFAAMVLIAWWAHRGQPYLQQDEFSHWGRAINRLFDLQKLPNAVAGAVDFPSYPPGSALFYCFWTWLGGAFSEGATISAANVAVMVCFLPLMSRTQWKRPGRAVCLLLVCLLLPLVFNHDAYRYVLVDILLGSIAAYAVMIWCLQRRDAAMYVMLGLAMLALALVKESGAAIGALMLVAMAIDLWRHKEGKQVWLLLIPAACLLVSVATWKGYLAAHGIVGEKPFRLAEIGHNLRAWLSGTSPSWQRYQFKNFFNYLTYPVMMGGGHVLKLSYVGWAAVLAAACCMLGSGQDAQGARHGRMLAVLTGITAVYAILMYHLYLYAFIPQEAASLHSFDRYMSSIMLPAAAVAVACLVEKCDREHRAVPGALAALLALMLVVSPTHLMQMTFTAPWAVEEAQTERGALYPPAHVLAQLDEGDRVAWITAKVNTDTSYRDYACNRYEFMPVALERPCSVFLTETVEANRALLAASGCTWAYCHEVTEAFVAEYGALFADPADIAPRTLYRIVGDGEDLLLEKAL